MTGFVRVILIVALIYFIMQIFIRYLLPIFLTRFINRKMEQMSGQAQSREKNKRREGEITIDYNQDNKKKQYPKNSGEYIDFEEINE